MAGRSRQKSRLGEQIRKYFVHDFLSRRSSRWSKTIEQKSLSDICESRRFRSSNPAAQAFAFGVLSKLPDSILKLMPKALDLLSIVLKSLMSRDSNVHALRRFRDFSTPSPCQTPTWLARSVWALGVGLLGRPCVFSSRLHLKFSRICPCPDGGLHGCKGDFIGSLGGELLRSAALRAHFTASRSSSGTPSPLAYMFPRLN